jgi:hypothetical protein
MPDPDTQESRRRAVSSAAASVRAEGLVPSAEYEGDAEEYAAGLISADELVERAEARHRGPGAEQPTP